MSNYDGSWDGTNINFTHNKFQIQGPEVRAPALLAKTSPAPTQSQSPDASRDETSIFRIKGVEKKK